MTVLLLLSLLLATDDPASLLVELTEQEALRAGIETAEVALRGSMACFAWRFQARARARWASRWTIRRSTSSWPAWRPWPTGARR